MLWPAPDLPVAKKFDIKALRRALSLPGEQGDYEERQLYKLDLLERDADEVYKRFQSYIAYDEMTSGRAIENARKDYKDVNCHQQVKKTLP